MKPVFVVIVNQMLHTSAFSHTHLEIDHPALDSSLFKHGQIEAFSCAMFLPYPPRYPFLSPVRMLPSQLDNPPLDLWVNGVRIMHSMAPRLTKPVYMLQRYSPADQPIQIDTFAAEKSFHRNKSSFSRSSFTYKVFPLKKAITGFRFLT